MESVASETTSTESTTTTPANEIALFRSGGEAPKSEPSTGVTTATPAATDRDETGRFKSKASETAATVVATEAAPAATATEAKPTDTPKPAGQLAALLAERSKRQELERKLAALEAGTSATPDIFTEPEKAVRAMVEQQVAPLKIRFFNRSIEDAQKANPDFHEAYENFSRLIEGGNQALLEELRQSDDPGQYIYLVGSNTPEFRQTRDTKHREVLTAKETEIAALKSQVAALENAQKARNEVPESLNRQPSGAVPMREGDGSDINKIVRFKSG